MSWQWTSFWVKGAAPLNPVANAAEFGAPQFRAHSSDAATSQDAVVRAASRYTLGYM
jgi:hypothetical protein